MDDYESLFWYDDEDYYGWNSAIDGWDWYDQD